MSARHDVTRRQMLQGLGAAGAAAAALSVGAGPADAQAQPKPFTPRGQLRRRPNFLVVVVDQQRQPPVYESATLQAWRDANLPTQVALRAHGMEFRNHYVMSTACVPSRASFVTGQYPSLHGVTQTSGIAKSAHESDIFWLDPATVPSMGEWFRAGGYDTYYKGKWHVSEEDLLEPGSDEPLPSYTQSLDRDPALEAVYLAADRLGPYGFGGWIGPEPHGSSPLNSASSGPGGKGRDALIAQQSTELLQQLRTSPKPWVAVTSFLNPHDIALWGELTLAAGNLYLAEQLSGSNVPAEADLFAPGQWAATRSDDLTKKPSAQSSYRDAYPQGLQPTVNGPDYHRFYYQLQKNVDAQIGQVLATLTAGPAYRDTIVIYFADHGEMLGAHGGLFQKWHVAYDEVIRVPFVVHNPSLFPTGASTDVLTSHADLLPTMLGLAGLDQNALLQQLAPRYTQARPLVGRDLSGFLLGTQQLSDDPQYFMTDDEPFRGAEQVSWNGQMYASVAQPCHLETVIANLPTGANGAQERWKYTRYFDDPAFWTSPGQKDVVTMVDGVATVPGDKAAHTTVKVQPAADEVELYNVTKDPTELVNIAADPVLMATPAMQQTVATLQGLLADQRSSKRLTPTMAQPLTGTAGRFRFGPAE
jgi:choline-sulfatase